FTFRTTIASSSADTRRPASSWLAKPTRRSSAFFLRRSPGYSARREIPGIWSASRAARAAARLRRWPRAWSPSRKGTMAAARFAEEVGRDPGRLRVAFTAKAPTCVPIHPECVKAVREAANLCADLGHEVEEDFPKINGNLFTKSFMDVWASGSGSMLDTIEKLGLKVERESIEPLSWALYEKGKKVTGPEYLVAQS